MWRNVKHKILSLLIVCIAKNRNLAHTEKVICLHL
uniref:Uncharacterized protein n=1 Tax=Siphoviridae sp. ctgn638 TaxID=2827913 RepID=A0A8S5TKQ9_9CAUD|nr:MAG TPA: hypothetical protein [Siphoviridae sp. ctgn638]